MDDNLAQNKVPKCSQKAVDTEIPQSISSGLAFLLSGRKWWLGNLSSVVHSELTISLPPTPDTDLVKVTSLSGRRIKRPLNFPSSYVRELLPTRDGGFWNEGKKEGGLIKILTARRAANRAGPVAKFWQLRAEFPVDFLAIALNLV
ncbi:hypothetical protein M8J75_009265 [Diaphorina citri]|nr:hypothetical protein M8J75_009265 [Diaphorina citri]